MKKLIIFSFLLIFITGNAFSEEKLKVFVSIMPQKFFTEQIGGEKVQVSVLVPQGRSPENFDPSARQIIELGKADVYLTMGIQSENMFLGRLKNSTGSFSVYDISAGIEKSGCHNHGHGEEHHHHGEADPHIWTDPVKVKKVAENIASALSEADSGNRDFYMANCREFISRLDKLDRDIGSRLAPYRGRIFYVYHSALDYFAQRYGLVQKSIETGSREPSPAQIRKLVAEAEADRVRTIFMQPEFPAAGTQKIAAAIKGEIIMFSVLEYDYINNMTYLAESLTRAFEKGSGN